MASNIRALLHQGKALFTPNGSTSTLAEDKKGEHGFVVAREDCLFPPVDPAVDGDDCLHDCDSCTIRLPAKFKIDETAKLYGHVNGWATHLLVATGKADWVRDVEDEKGSVMEAIGKCDVKPANGRLMLSASNIPLLDPDRAPYDQPTRCLLLPAFRYVDNVVPSNARELLTSIVSAAPTTTGRLEPREIDEHGMSMPNLLAEIPSPFTTRPCPHDALILLCSQATRDARCGQSAPLLRREFERHLRPLGLYRDLDDDRPGGVGIYFISHVGGHKFSANVMIYRRAGFGSDEEEREARDREAEGREASQCIWLARVRPNECEGIVKFTVLQGKVVKPDRQLRGGFDRERGVCSW